MSEGEAREADMEKSTGRQSSVPPRPNGAESKKDGNGQRSKRRNGKFKDSRPKHEGTTQRRTPQTHPHKFRQSDRKPRPREYNGPKQEVTHEEANYGSVYKPGSKKQNYNHLLNFSYGARERDGDMGERRPYVGSRSTRQRSSRVYYNKEQFLQANCQFVVLEGEDYSTHSADSDTLVEWSLIEQIRLFGEGVPSCPICLSSPVAAKMTRCGHIYCWSCILHYLSLGEKSWAKCPICFEAVHESDLKSVIALAAQTITAKDEITMVLMKRSRGSTYAAPVDQWIDSYAQPFNIQDTERDTRFSKLLTAHPQQIQTLILDPERSELQLQLEEEEAESLDESYIRAALEALAKREVAVAARKFTKTASAKMFKQLSLDDPPACTKETAATLHSAKPIAKYASPFDKEEDKESVGVFEPEKAAPENVPHDTEDCPETSVPASPKFMVSSEGDSGSQGISDASDIQDEARAASPCSTEDNCTTALALPSFRQPNKLTETYYFYQAASGRHIYLHSLNARCLMHEYGSLEKSPTTLTATVTHIEPCTMTEDQRSRMRYINHLPLTCEFQVVELDFKPPVVSNGTLQAFKDDIKKRRNERQRKQNAETRKLRKMQEEENRKTEKLDPHVRAAMGVLHNVSFPEMKSVIVPSDAPNLHNSASSGQLVTPVGSPDSIDSSSPSFSYSQALRTASKPTWPKPSTTTTAASEPPSAVAWPSASSTTVRGKKSPDSEDSDNEDRVPVPEYKAAFADWDFSAVLNKATSAQDDPVTTGVGGGKKKKKGKQKQVLFSTNMTRGN